MNKILFILAFNFFIRRSRIISFAEREPFNIQNFADFIRAKIDKMSPGKEIPNKNTNN